MPTSNGIITAPISTTDVGTALQVSSHDVGTLCSHDNINMWSRFKPVSIHNSPAPDRDSEWWRAWDSSCNIMLPNQVSSYKQVKQYITSDGINGYAYRKVTGGSFDPYRLADFNKYKHDAVPPIHGITTPDQIAQGQTLSIACIRPTPDLDKTQPGSLLMEDIQTDNGFTFADYYFGIMLENSNGDIIGRVTSTSPNAFSANLEITTGFQPGNYIMYCFLSSVQLTQDGTDIAGVYYPVPNCSPKTIKVITEDDLVDIKVVATYIVLNEDINQKVRVNYTITASTQYASQQLTNNTITLRFSTSSPNDTLLNGESRQTLPDFQASSTEWTYSGGFEINANYRDRTYYLYVSLGTGRYTGTFSPMLPAS